MAKQLLKFGDENSADIILRLIDSDGVEFGRNPVFLHSQVLRKSEFYEAMLSDRWSSDQFRPLKISISASTGSIDDLIKCIELMYSCEASKHFCFSSVDDVLTILPVASELLFQECVQECMQYLNAVRWNPLQEAEIRALITSLQLNSVPVELAARLCLLLAEFVQEMLSMASKNSQQRSVAEKCIVSYFEASDPSSPVAVTCSCVLVREFSLNVELLKRDMAMSSQRIDTAYADLLWLVQVIQDCDRELFKTVLKMLLPYVEDILDILIYRFLEALGNGGVITPTSFRVLFSDKLD